MNGGLLASAGTWLSGFFCATGTKASAVAGLGVAIVAWWHGLPQPINALLLALVIAMAADFMCGVAAAIHEEQFRWRGLVKGFTKIVAYAGVILVSVAVDKTVPAMLPSYAGPLFVIWALGFLTICDAISVSAHLEKLGVPMPSGMRNILKKLKQGLDAGGQIRLEGTTGDGHTDEG